MFGTHANAHYVSAIRCSDHTTTIMDYETIQTLHNFLPPFSPYVSTSLLPFIALVLLSSTFALAFYFSTLPKTAPVRELGVALLASVLGGFGVVALFCSVGVYV